MTKKGERARVLVTGATGFIGSHLIDALVEKDVEVYGTTQDLKGNEMRNISHLKNKLELIECDIRDRSRVETIVEKVKPEKIFHLAAQAYVIPSWKDPVTTFDTNVKGTIYLFEATRKAKINPTIVVSCSSAEYGFMNKPPFKETDVLMPVSPYGVSKAAQDMLGYQYFANYGMRIIRARIFNTTGPRKIGDVFADFAVQIARNEKGKQQPIMRVGNLETMREVLDVRDVVRALTILSDRGRFGEAYNICSGKPYKICDILEMLLKLTEKRINVKQDARLMRHTDEPIIIGDNTKMRTHVGWEPKIPVEQTLKDIVDYWRQNRKAI